MPWDQWRHDLNHKLDKWGEEKFNLPASRESKKDKRGLSYEERLANIRSGGGAAGHMQVTSSQQRPRAVPPPPSSAQPSHPTTQYVTSQEAPAVVTASTTPGATGPSGTTHIEFSRFTESDKQAFFALLDEYFSKQGVHGGDMWYV